jgi:hypothetical protein
VAHAAAHTTQHTHALAPLPRIRPSHANKPQQRDRGTPQPPQTQKQEKGRSTHKHRPTHTCMQGGDAHQSLLPSTHSARHSHSQQVLATPAHTQPRLSTNTSPQSNQVRAHNQPHIIRHTHAVRCKRERQRHIRGNTGAIQSCTCSTSAVCCRRHTARHAFGQTAGHRCSRHEVQRANGSSSSI